MVLKTAERNKPFQRTMKLVYKNRWNYVLVLPALLIFLFFHYFPMYGIQLAFKDYAVRKGIAGSPWVGFKHFEVLLNSQVFQRALSNTLIISLYKLCLGFPSAIIFALMLNEMRSDKFKRMAQTVSYMPHFISWIVLGGIVKDLLSPSTGIINYFVTSLGGDAKHFIIEPDYFRSIIVITGIWKEVGWQSIIYLAAIAGISTELYEAAAIDGASRLRIIRHIIIPELMSVMSIQFILQLGRILNAGFDQVFNLYNELVYVTGDIIDTYVYRIGLQGQMQYSLSTAVGLFKNCVGLILVIGTNAVVRRLGEGENALW